MSSQIHEVKSTDDEPEEGEIQDDEELEDVSSDDEISSIAKHDSVLYSPSFPRQKSSKTKRRGLPSTPRSDMIFHGSTKGDHVSQFVPKRSRSGVRNGRHDYYESCQRYKTFKDHHSKGRVHEKENKAREKKKLHKKKGFRNTAVELRSGYPGPEHGETRVSSTSSKDLWHKSELKEKHKKKKKSKSNKSYPLGEVHESQHISENSTDDLKVVVKSTMEVKGNTSVSDEGNEHQIHHPEPDKVPSPTTSEIEILEVPIKVPEVITIGDSDDDFRPQEQISECAEMNVIDNPSDDCGKSGVPVEHVKNVCENVDPPDLDEYLLREAALNSSKGHHSSNLNHDDEVLQLRLAALRSAIIRKHEERKKRGITLTKRDKNDEENQVLSISPLSSPNHCSEDSFIRVSNGTAKFLSSEEFNVICDRRSGDNDTEDQIAAIDMELESEEERELISAQSEDSISHVIEKITHNDKDYCKVSDDSMTNTIGNEFSEQEVLPSHVPHSVSTSCSGGGSFQTETVECSSGFIIGDDYQQLDFDEELLSLSFPFQSQSGTDGVGIVVGNEQNITLHSHLESDSLHKCDSASDKEMNTEELRFQEESTSQHSHTVISAVGFDLENEKAEHHQSFDLLFRQSVSSDEHDSCSTGDLDLESMIVLDEVGRCSDDNKSESSIVDIVRSVQELCCREISGICVTPISAGNLRDRFVESPSVDKSFSESLSENIFANSERSIICDENIHVETCDSMKRSNTESDFQSENEELKIDLCKRANEVKLQGLEGLEGCDVCDNSFATSGLSKNKDLKMISDSSSLLNSAVPFCDSNSGGSCIEENAMEFRFKNSEVDNASILTTCKLAQLPADLNGANAPCEAKSHSLSIPAKDQNNDLRFDGSKLQPVNIENTTCNTNAIAVDDEEEELLRLSLLAMLSKRSDESTQRNESNDSSQSTEGQELKTTNSGCVENLALESDVNPGSLLTLGNDTAGAKEREKILPRKQVVPFKSLSSKLENYQHRLHFSLANSNSYSSRKRLCSINKRGAKCNKNRMLTNNTPRPNVNVPELVINLGEDSDSGDELTVCENQNVVSGGSVDSLSGSKVVPPDFEKKLDLLLKQARFEQETNTSEEKDEDQENSLDVKSVDFAADLSKSIFLEESKSSKCAQSSSLTSNLNRDLVISKPISVSSSLSQESGVLAKKKKLSTLNLIETSKHSSRSNAGKTITSGVKKFVTSTSCKNKPAMSLVDIRLLPSNKQKEYIRLKNQLAQLVGRNDDKSKNKLLSEKVSDSKPKRVNGPLLMKMSTMNRKLMEEVKAGSQTLRIEFEKVKKLARTGPVVSKLQTQVPGRLSSSSNYKLVSLPRRQVLSSQQKKLLNTSSNFKKINPTKSSINTQQKKLLNTSSNFKKINPTQCSINAQQKELPVITSHLSTQQNVETREVLQNNSEPKPHREKDNIDKLPHADGESGKESNSKKSAGVKRKKSASESCEIIPKVSKSVLESSSGHICGFVQSDNSSISHIADEHSEATGPMEKKLDDELTSSNFSDSNTDDSHSETIGCEDRKLVEELWSSEQKLMARRYQVLEDISCVRINLHDIKRINADKQHILRDMKSLKEKLSLAESQLKRSDDLLNSLYSKVEKAKRNIMRGQSETLLLSVECEEKGCKIHGSDYNVPGMCTDLIRNGMLSVSQELQDIEDGKNCEEFVCEMPTLCTSSEGNSQQKEDVAQCINHLIVDTNVEESRRNIQNFYSSPLDAMRTESGSDIQAVLCPYHIMGSCKDKECSYLH